LAQSIDNKVANGGVASSGVDSSVLAIEGLWVSYGHIRALRGVDLRVEKGELVVLVGSNGAGKSTAINAVLGVAPAEKGRIRYLGTDITRRPTERIVAAGVSVVPEGRGILPLMTVFENLQLGAYHIRGKKNVTEAIDEVFGRFPILAERRGQVAGTLSGGQQQILAIARALVSRPTLLLIDEPSIGLAPIMVDQVFEVLSELKRNRQTILLAEQNARTALAHADRGYVLDLGETTLEGTAKELLQNPDVCRAYLGGAG
jgi:branched-chain amino acid transport system ATP-binding protein